MYIFCIFFSLLDVVEDLDLSCAIPYLGNKVDDDITSINTKIMELKDFVSCLRVINVPMNHFGDESVKHQVLKSWTCPFKRLNAQMCL